MKQAKKTGGWKGFFALFKTLNRRHLHVFLFEFLFVALVAAGGFLFGRMQLLLQARVQGVSIESIVAGLPTGAAAGTIASMRSTLLIVLGLVFLFLAYTFLCWILTRALIWRALIHSPLPFFRFWLKLLLPGLAWTLITLIPLWLVFSYFAKIYMTPLFPIVSRLSGYTYIFFIQLAVVVMLMLYCHFTNLFYISFCREPKFRAVWEALKTGVAEFPKYAKPLGILLIFFAVVMAAGSLASLLPEPLKIIGAFASFFVFSTVSRAWYAAVGGR